MIEADGAEAQRLAVHGALQEHLEGCWEDGCTADEMLEHLQQTVTALQEDLHG